MSGASTHRRTLMEMRKATLFIGIAGILLPIVILSCKKQAEQPGLNLENTVWRLKKEVWTYPNGNTEVFEKKTNAEGVSTWLFLSDQKVKILYEPYSFQQNGDWIHANNLTTIRLVTNTNDDNTRDFVVRELSANSMILDAKTGGSTIASSEHGIASKVYYELERQ